MIQNEEGREALEEIKLLLQYLETLDCLKYVELDFCLARGLDYYTGIIYEAELVEEKGRALKLGSIAAGGRYDHLIGSFCNKDIPAIGVSIGIERIFRLLEEVSSSSLIREKETEVVIIQVGKGLLNKRLQLCKTLWDAGVRCEILLEENPTI